MSIRKINRVKEINEDVRRVGVINDCIFYFVEGVIGNKWIRDELKLIKLSEGIKELSGLLEVGLDCCYIGEDSSLGKIINNK